MLDLAFVRANLPLVEEKLRARNMDPAAVLGDFYVIDRDRRNALRHAENGTSILKAVSESIGKAKRNRQEKLSILEVVAAVAKQPELQDHPIYRSLEEQGKSGELP